MKSKKYKHPFARISDRETYVRMVSGDIYLSTTTTTADTSNRGLSLHDWRRHMSREYGTKHCKLMCRIMLTRYNDRLGPQLKLRDNFS